MADDTVIGGSKHHFPTTHRSSIAAVQREDPEVRGRALGPPSRPTGRSRSRRTLQGAQYCNRVLRSDL